MSRRGTVVFPHRDPPPPTTLCCIRLWCEKCSVEYIPVTTTNIELFCDCGKPLTAVFEAVDGSS